MHRTDESCTWTIMHMDVSGATKEQSQCRKCVAQPAKTLLEADMKQSSYGAS